jgi:hypothetical protein
MMLCIEYKQYITSFRSLIPILLHHLDLIERFTYLLQSTKNKDDFVSCRWLWWW